MDGITKIMSPEEEAAVLKLNKEQRAELVEKHITGLSDEHFKPEYLTTHGERTVTVKFLSRHLSKVKKTLIRRALNECHEVVDHLLEEYLLVLRNRCRKIEAEIAELKSGGPNLADAFKGGWMYGAYKRGSLVTQGGCLWLALADNDQKPGTSDSWKQVTKAGRDGKDVR